MSISTFEATLTSCIEEERRVAFDKIHIRQYKRSLGDNPSVSSGPALAIGWEYDPHVLELDVDSYESLRGDRRHKQEMALSRSTRESILEDECGCSRSELARCVREINAAKAKRRQTMTNLQFFALEEKAEEIKRSICRIMCARQSTKVEIDKLWVEAARANRFKNLSK